MSLRHCIALGVVLTAFAATAAQACPNDPSTATTVAPGPRPHPRAAEIVAYRPHAWRPVSFAAAPGSAGMTVSIDPVDGAMTVPAPGSLESALLESLDQDLTPVSVLHRADGSVRAQLDERWDSHAVATIGPDGKPRWTCVNGTHGAAQFMKQPVIPVVVSPTPVPEEK
jgi:hypothetical protein